MAPEDFKRKLTAILSADVEGYSRLMGDDEDATIRTLTTYRELMATLIEKHRGRVVDSPGDNLLAEFGSVVDAVRCAVEIQEELRVRNAELSEDRKMVFRIGINLGDVVEEGERIYGDGINIAARVEGLAEGGGICISGSVYDSIKNKLSLSYVSMGEHAVKNITEPVRVYRMRIGPEAVAQKEAGPKRWRWAALAGVAALILVIGGVAIWNFYLRRPSVEAADPEKMAFPLPEKPSIAVLPFDNLSGDPEQEYIADGISENIISTLSKVSKMFVISRNSTFTYKGKPVNVRQVAEEMGVRYVLEGSVQKSGDQLRVIAQLIDAINGHHLWSEKYDRKMRDLFDLQDEITKKIVVSLQVEIGRGVGARLRAKSTNNFEAWTKVSKGRELYMKNNKEDNIRARALFETASKLDPGYTDAWIWLASTHQMDARRGWSESRAASMKLAHEFLQKAMALDDKNPTVHVALGHIYYTQRQLEKAMSEYKMAISLDPNFGAGYALVSRTMIFMGEFEDSITSMKKAMRLSPYYDAWYLIFLGQAYIFTRRYEEAIATFNLLLDRCRKGECPTWWAPYRLAWVKAELGRLDEARALMAEALKINPKLSLAHLRRVNPFKDPAHLQRVLDAAIKSGLHEKASLPLPDKPSIAVLPLNNISDDPKQEYFVDGLTETLITDLSKISELFVIASTSMFTYKGKSVKVEQIGRDLGVRYVLEGSVQRADNQLRINAQLIDVKTGGHLWAERYDGKMDNIFSLQDNITQKIVSALAVKLTTSEREQVAGKYTDNIEAYDAFLKGVGHAVRYTPNDTRQAIRYLKKAIELDPNYGPAYARLGRLYWGTPPPWTDLKWPLNFLMPRNYLQAAMKSPDPYAHRLAARINLRLRRYKEAISEAERALALAPNDPETYETMVMVLNFAGRPKEAVKFVKLQMRHDPRRIYSALSRLGRAQFSMGNLEQAVTSFKRSLTYNPENFINHLFLAATYANLGKLKDARESLDNYYSLIGGRKSMLRGKMYRYPFKTPEVAERFADGLLKAGMKGKSSGYYKILEENQLTGEEIRKLVFGREIRTFSLSIGRDYVNRTEDGAFKHAGFGPGKSRIVDDMLCDKWNSRYKGLEYCGTLFRNPEGTPVTNDEYLYVTDFEFRELSPVREGPPSGPYTILEENRLSGEEIRELLFGRTISGFTQKLGTQYWIKSSTDGKKIKYRNSRGFSDSGKGWLEGNLRCEQWEKLVSRLPDCYHVYRNPDGIPEKKNGYLAVGKDTITSWSPVN